MHPLGAAEECWLSIVVYYARHAHVALSVQDISGCAAEVEWTREVET
jgi:hypothetical protein